MRVDEDPDVLADLRTAVLGLEPDNPFDADGMKSARALRLRFIYARGWHRSRDEFRDPLSRHTCPLVQAFRVEVMRERKRMVAEHTGVPVALDELRTKRVSVDGREMTLGEAMDLLAPMLSPEAGQ